MKDIPIPASAKENNDGYLVWIWREAFVDGQWSDAVGGASHLS